MVDEIATAVERIQAGLSEFRAPGSPVAELDNLDKQIVAALQIMPRASWRQIAQVVNRSESTVKRRSERLLDMGAVRVTAFAEHVWPSFPVLVQITCDFSRGPDVARRLAERDDVRFAAVVTGPFDVVAELIVPSHRKLVTIMLEDFPALTGIRATSTETVLRTFKRSYDWSQDLLGLDPEEIEAASTFTLPKVPVQLDQISQQLLAVLKEDGRTGYATLASRCGISESVARYRVEHLLSRAGVRIVTIIDPHVLGFDTQLLVWIRVDLARREAAARALSAHPAVNYVAATSGYSDLVCEVYLRSQDEVYSFSDQLLGNVPGIKKVNVATELLTVKRGNIRLDDVR